MALQNKITGKHSRNPSGLRNKIRWILSQTKWDLNNYDIVHKSVYGENPEPKKSLK